MYLKTLKIRNFRNFHKAEINLNSEDNILIGDNGSGKTNLFNAIRLVLDNDYRLEKFLCDKDFNHKVKPKLFGHWIIITAILSGFDEEEENVSRHDFSIDEAGNSYINFIFKPKDKILDILFQQHQGLFDLEGELRENKKRKIQQFMKSLNVENDYEAIRTFNKPVDFFDDEKYNSLIGDFKNIAFTNEKYKDSKYIGVSGKVHNALKQINVTYVPPIRDVRENLSSSNGMFTKLINERYDEMTDEDIDDIASKVLDLNNKISSIEQFQELKNNMYEKMNIVGKNYFDSKFEIESNISNNKKELVKSLSLKIADYEEVVDIWRKSLGEANIIYFALKLLESETKQGTFRSKILDLLLIEEPEAHIHGHLQKALFRNLKETKNRQLMISTHSVNISEVSKISKMLILNNGFKETIICNPSHGFSPIEIRRIERYLDANRSMLLFSKSVILVEGDAENIIIPWLIQNTFDITLDEMGISIININSTFFQALLPLFNNSRIAKKCAIITDLDLDYTEKKTKEYAQTLGEGRKEKLTDITKNNDFLEVFYADNTFEIQLFEIDSNKQILIDMIKSDDNIIYSDEKTKQEKIQNIKSENIMKESIMEVIEYNKKGWFALDLIEYCEKNDISLNIPEYIIDAFNWIIINKENLNLIKWCLSSFLRKNNEEEEMIIQIEKSSNFNELKNVVDKIKLENNLMEKIKEAILNVD